MHTLTSSSSSNDIHAMDTHTPRRGSTSGDDTPTDGQSMQEDASSRVLSGNASSRSLVISSNLNAALEYDERTRGEASAALLLSAAGLRPPPRPKSRGQRTVRSPPLGEQGSSQPNSPTVSPDGLGLRGSGSGAPGSNPYINPAPRISDLLFEDQLAAAVLYQSLTRRNSGDQESVDESPTSAQGRLSDESRGSPTLSPVVGSAVAGVGEDGSRAGSTRHNRYLSQRMEKMLGKGKSALNVLADTTSARGVRRVSDADVRGEKGGKEALLRRMLERGAKSPTEEGLAAPRSPTVSASASVAVSGPGSASVAVFGSNMRLLSPRPAVLPPARAGHSHGRRSSLASFSSEESQSQETTESLAPRRISISSTLYSANQRSFDNTDMNTDRESFIDLTSPADDHFPVPLLHIPLAPPPYHAHSALKPPLPKLPTSPSKPPLPTTPKPVFNTRRSRSAQPSQPRARDGPSPEHQPHAQLPATTNYLDPRERADRVRKTRKLTQLFGQTPGTTELSPQPELTNGCLPIPSPLNLSLTKRKQHRAAVSMSDEAVLPVHVPRRAAWPPPEDTQYLHVAGRRHSTPLSPRDLLDTASILDIGPARHVTEMPSQQGNLRGDWDSHPSDAVPDADSPTSFIDLSEEDLPRGALSDTASIDTPRLPWHPGQPFPPSTPSIMESFSDEQRAEEDRRRKRDKIAKLHRFLGSRVPTHLVLGPLDEGVPLPAPAISPLVFDEDSEARKMRVRRRRSSSAAEFSRTWSDDIDRLKEELNEKEKAINVRRAHKMEKMFGVAPPQVLYHTRQAVSSPGSLPRMPSPQLTISPKSSPQASPRVQSPAPPAHRNAKPSKTKLKKNGRPGTAESVAPLLNENDELDLGATLSDVYLHYRHSLNSLNDIIDRDDKQSLVELHDYLSGDTSPATPPVEYGIMSATSKAERRRSLPSRTSMVSISELSLASPDPDDTLFQQRRRKAAKLTQFFGVNYRDVMNEILESIEKGFEEERGRGTLKPSEVQDLQQQLVNLKTKRNRLS